MNVDDLTVLFDADTIAARVDELGRRIEREIVAEDPLILSHVGGSVIFLADLVRAIDAPLKYEFIQVDYRSGSDTSSGDDQVLDIHYPLPVDLEGRSVLVLKDVATTGVIETYLANQLSERGATRVRFAALVDLPKERKTSFQVDYSVFTTERDGRLVGYGMKQDGHGGNLPYIATTEARGY